MIFKYKEYEDFLKFAKSQGEIIPLRDFEQQRAIILRHDVDLDIESAHRLAAVEHQCDVCSSYFILLTGQTYNPLSQNNRNLIRQISELGFEIGLHFDPTIYPGDTAEELADYLEQECRTLVEISRQPVKSISLHNPSIHGSYPLFKNFHNSYDPSVFSDDRYMSDSKMDFRGKDPFTFVKKVKESTIQILLHPEHFSEKGHNYPGIFVDYVRQYTTTIDQQFRANSTYDQQMTKELFSLISSLGAKK